MATIGIRKYKQTNYLHIDGSSAKPLVFYIPGNPGVCDYYREYISTLNELTGYECIVVPQLGCDIHSEPQSQPSWTLQEQVEHKISLLKHLGAGREIVVLGHSIGAWMAQRVCVRLASTMDIKFVGLMAPTLGDMSQSDRGKSLTWFKDKFGSLGISSLVGVAKGFSYLPESILRVMVEMFVPRNGVQATLALAQRPYILHQVLTMAFEEMDRVGKGVENDDIAGFWSLGIARWIMYAAADHWVPESTKAETIAHAKSCGQTKVETRDVAHAFVLLSSADVAKYTANALLEAL